MGRVSYSTEEISYIVVNGTRYTLEEYMGLQTQQETQQPNVTEDTNSTENSNDSCDFPDVSYIVLNGDKYSIDDEQATTDLVRLSDSIATQYSAESTYNVNQYCIYEGYLYICTDAILTPEPFDDSHWERVVLADIVGTGGGSGNYNWGNGLIYAEETNTVSVDVVDDAIEYENRPISSNGVWKELGNVAILLGTI